MFEKGKIRRLAAEIQEGRVETNEILVGVSIRRRDQWNPRLRGGTLLLDGAPQREGLGIAIDAPTTDGNDLPCNYQRHLIFLQQKIAWAPSI